MRKSKAIILHLLAVIAFSASLAALDNIYDEITAKNPPTCKISPDGLPASTRNLGQLRPGARFPQIPADALTGVDGKPFDLNAHIQGKPALIVAIRQIDYDPICLVQTVLDAYPELKAMGYEVAAYTAATTGIREIKNRYNPNIYRYGMIFPQQEPPFPFVWDGKYLGMKAVGLMMEKDIEIACPDTDGFRGPFMGIYTDQSGKKKEVAGHRGIFFVDAKGIVQYEFVLNPGFTIVSALNQPGRYCSNLVNWPEGEFKNKKKLPRNMMPQQIIAIAKMLQQAKPGYFNNLNEALKNPDQVKGLNLSYQDLKEFPKDIFKLTNLADLRLNNNQIKVIPPQIAELAKLQWLELSSNQISQLPREIGNLPELRELDLFKNKLTGLPAEIGDSKKLERLELAYNPIAALPPEIGNLQELRILRLFEHRMTSLPPEIGKLQKLLELYLIGSKDADGKKDGLESLPVEIGSLRDLTILVLLQNNLTVLPPEIGQLKHLHFLNLDDNKLTELPNELAHLPLSYLYCGNNQLTEIPAASFPRVAKQILADNNQIRELPASVGKFKGYAIGIRNNQLKKLPQEFLELLKTKAYFHLKLAGNPIPREEQERINTELQDRSFKAGFEPEGRKWPQY